jgi:hypothetical protein
VLTAISDVSWFVVRLEEFFFDWLRLLSLFLEL